MATFSEVKNVAEVYGGSKYMYEEKEKRQRKLALRMNTFGTTNVPSPLTHTRENFRI